MMKDDVWPESARSSVCDLAPPSVMAQAVEWPESARVWVHDLAPPSVMLREEESEESWVCLSVHG
jgi:hypothetical protein